MNTIIPDYDNKLKVVIGNLLSKADSVSKSVLSAFDSSKDVADNVATLSGPRFKADALSTCAKFLNIVLVNLESERLFSNKPSLAKRIVFEIEALYSTICADCGSEYSINFTPSPEPALRRFLCLQGCHDCISSCPINPTCKGTVWLCKPCHDSNNPVQTKKSKSKMVSKEPSRKASSSGIITPLPGEDQKMVQASADELNAKLENILHQQNQLEDKSKRPNMHPEDVCNLLKVGKCPHGVSGKTAANGQQSCSMLHPKRCLKFIRNATHRKHGCNRGKKCTFFHPDHCPSAISDKCCFSQSCTLVHPKGTKRRKPAENESNRAPSHPNKRRNTNTTFSTNKKSGTNRNDSQVSAHPGCTTPKPRAESFLELQSLLTKIQSTFRKEIETLKLNISRQESTLATLIPGSSKHPLALNLHPHFPHNQGTWLQHGQILQPHLPSHPQSFVHHQQMKWLSIPASGC